MHRLTWVLALLAATGAGATPAPQGAPPAPEGYWKLDETSGTTAADSSGHGHTGTLMFGATISTLVAPLPPNNQRSVAIVNATNEQHIRVPHSAAFDFTAGFTLACWIRLDASPTPNTQMGLIERWSNGTTAVNGYMLRLGRIDDPATGHHLKVNVGNGTTQIEAAEYTAIPKDTWIHLAAIWNPTTATLNLYKNGTLAASQSAPAGSVTGTTEDLEIAQSGPHRLQGNIDEVYVFGTALTQPQLAILVNGQPPPTAPLTVTPLVDQLSVSWGAAPDAASYNLYRSDNGGAFFLLTSTTSTSYTDPTATYPGTYAYQVTAVGFMESAPLGPVSGSPFSPIPRTNDHSEGLLEDRCACGSTIVSTSSGSWLALLALLGVFVRRRST